jgi:hypothetical protein
MPQSTSSVASAAAFASSSSLLFPRLRDRLEEEEVEVVVVVVVEAEAAVEEEAEDSPRTAVLSCRELLLQLGCLVLAMPACLSVRTCGCVGVWKWIGWYIYKLLCVYVSVST